MNTAPKTATTRRGRLHWLDVLLCAVWVLTIVGGLYVLAEDSGFSPYVGPFDFTTTCTAGQAC